MTSDSTPVFGVGEFVAYVNQTLEMSYPFVTVEGEVSGYRVSKGKWVYFDLKDETAMVRCFSTIYMLHAPLEDGMMVRVSGSPRLHPLYNFTFNVQAVMAIGEGALRRQADLLRVKLEAEGLFDPGRKRRLPAVPRHIALIASEQSAAYADFVKIAQARWGGIVIDHFDVQVQGEVAAEQIVGALAAVNALAEPPEALVLTRGGGSAEDLASFNDERVVRAVAASRVPTLVAVGHEVDTVLAELAADARASTPSNAAELLLPDKREEQRRVQAWHRELDNSLHKFIMQKRQQLGASQALLTHYLLGRFDATVEQMYTWKRLLVALDPHRPLQHGYALVHSADGLVSRASALQIGETIEVEFVDGYIVSQVQKTRLKGV